MLFFQSSEIVKMLDTEFNEFAKKPDFLRPKELVEKIDERNDWMYNSINNGVYRCGFARSQTACMKTIHFNCIYFSNFLCSFRQ